MRIYILGPHAHGQSLLFFYQRTEMPASCFIQEQKKKVKRFYFCPKWPQAVSLVKSLFLWKRFAENTGAAQLKRGALFGIVRNGWWCVWINFKVSSAKENNSDAVTSGKAFASSGSFQTSSLTYQRQPLTPWSSFSAASCPVNRNTGTSSLSSHPEAPPLVRSQDSVKTGSPL